MLRVKRGCLGTARAEPCFRSSCAVNAAVPQVLASACRTMRGSETSNQPCVAVSPCALPMFRVFLRAYRAHRFLHRVSSLSKLYWGGSPWRMCVAKHASSAAVVSSTTGRASCVKASNCVQLTAFLEERRGYDGISLRLNHPRFS